MESMALMLIMVMMFSVVAGMSQACKELKAIKEAVQAMLLSQNRERD